MRGCFDVFKELLDSPSFLIPLLFILFVVCYSMHRYINLALKRKSGYNKITPVFESLIRGAQFQPVDPDSEEGKQLRLDVQSFEDPLLPGIFHKILLAVKKTFADGNIYLFFEEIVRKKTELVRTRRGTRRVQKTYYFFKQGMFYPIRIPEVSRMYVRPRMDPQTEEKISYKEGMETLPEKGILEFDQNFVCKGESSIAVGKVITMDVQKIFTRWAGDFPFAEPQKMKTRVHFNEKGIYINMEVQNSEKLESLIEFSRELAKALK